MTRNVTCLACDAPDPRLVLSLGETPLANAFVRDPGAPEPRFPLELVFCGRCSLVQLSERVDPEVLFRDYVYLTGASSTMAQHHDELARGHVARFGLGEDSLVVDVASNDGSLLLAFQRHGVRTLGIEPARNVAAIARDRGVETVDEFFGTKTATSVLADFGPADVICANNVLAHVPDLVGFLNGCRLLAGERGVVSVEVPYLGHLLDRLEYDTIYHEHLSYFSVLAIAHAFWRARLAIFDLVHVPVHGGTVRVLARPGREHGPAVAEACAAERARGLDRAEAYLDFARRVEANRGRLVELLRGLRSKGLRVAAYGAAAKGNTLLNTCGIGPDLVEYVVDRNPLKVGTLTPGMRIPVRPVEHLEEAPPDALLVLPWNLVDEIVAQEAGSRWRRAGGRFVVPIPEPRILP
jgi:hypothetical protein